MAARIDIKPEPAYSNEFPTLELDELDMGPARMAVPVAAIEHRELPALLAKYLPSVVHACARGDQHEFIDTVTGAAVVYRVSLDARNQVRATIAEAGPRGLWDRLVVVCGEWERAGRPSPGELGWG